MPGTGPPWWRGSRGEWYVAGQLALMALVFFGPRTLPGWPAWPAGPARAALVTGAALMLAGGVLLIVGLTSLGANLTPLPHPKPGGSLVESGPYQLVRHPMYAGGLGLAFGWALVVHGWLTLGYAVALLAFLDLKSTREERWLVEKFAGYEDYRRRVRKLIPFVY